MEDYIRQIEREFFGDFGGSFGGIGSLGGLGGIGSVHPDQNERFSRRGGSRF